ncbi:hypothetical protein DICPUDRAFT_93663 [Dictyostelium purpureum]|uniref:Translation elongation factor EF1B beta/delta subunit guanine nucleotide exchange domain-containing protein n=1 Tax=Dictyostelium purpureum TaxID=5786 RepID=F0ZAA3_DICPU|nr:uncharacterized protein DICPUDRAFT_93663 [Dictyostelium purpureum]EGC39113.1 hypothetical protein DICPUDRAFT_93663 [Dictyostelium purpureum]|eukprot:XP_003284365.1 hypothetical protein DICPUDRAFT_93663 [Dictyostelium purpureum]
MHKTSVIFCVAPATEDTDIREVETKIKSIKMKGLTWGDCKKDKDIGIGKLNRLKMLAVVENDTSVDEIEERISRMKDLVQSVDIEAMSEI